MRAQPTRMLLLLLLTVLSLSWPVAGDCSSGCTNTSFRGYASCLTQRCGTNVAVTSCDCPTTNCQLCPGDGRCCQTCCNLSQCDCSAVSCQSGCTTACCSWCCSGAPCQQQQPCAQPCTPQQQQPCSQPCTPQQQPCPISTTTSPLQPSLPIVNNAPPQLQTIVVPPATVNITMPNITVIPANISFTPHITVVVNTSPVSQVYASQYGGNATATVLQSAAQPLNCSQGQRKCCRVVVVPRGSCPPGQNCPPVQRVACGAQCALLVQQAMYSRPPPPTYSPYYFYQPPPMYYGPQSSEFFCASGCMPTPAWPFLDCSSALYPYGAGRGTLPAGAPPGGAYYLGTAPLPITAVSNATSE